MSVQELIWSMLEEMGVDLENNNDMAEICDKYTDLIKEKIKQCHT